MKLINSKKLILASESPRRKALLEQLGIPIKICPSRVDEEKVAKDFENQDTKKEKTAETFAIRLSELKAGTTAALYPDDWVLGADTIVVTNNIILGKPRSKTDAFSMLKQLNNTEHSVFTGFCICHKNNNRMVSRALETRVCFKHCTDEELQWYIETGEPFGKAGAYAIQEKGAFMVKSIAGSYSNVVGLPVCEVIEELKDLNLIQY